MTVFDTDMRIFETRDHIPDEGSIYGEHITKLRAVMHNLLRSINLLRDKIKAENGTDPVDHCLARIKSDESMREKCRRKGLPETTDSALCHMHDAIGIRIVCRFLNDVYMMRDALAELPNLEIIREKDYIRHAKSNGYRSFHMIIRADGQYFVELQLRTISMDTWAALEHHMRYKKHLLKNDNLIAGELKRCADELASTDVSMQTIRDMIKEESS